MTVFDAVDLGRECNFDAIDMQAERGPLNQSLLQAAIGSTTSEMYRSHQWLQYFISRGVSVDHDDTNGDTALHYSIARAHNEITLFLIDKKADVNALNAHGNGPLWVPILNTKTSPDIITALLAAGADSTHVNAHGRSCKDLVKEMNVPWLHAALNEQ